MVKSAAVGASSFSEQLGPALGEVQLLRTPLSRTSPWATTSGSWWSFGSFGFATWNCRSLFGGHRRPKTHRARMQLLGKLMDKHDAVCLQEIRGSPSDVAVLGNELDKHVVFSSHTSGGRGGGVAWVVSKNFMKRFNSAVSRPIVHGRVLQLMLQGEKGNLNLTTVHLEPSWSDAYKKEVLKLINSSSDSDSTISIVSGDFNVVDAEEGRFHPRNGSWTTTDRSFSKWFSSAFPRWIELHQDSFTHQTIQSDEVYCLSRIDKAYIDLPELELMDAKPIAGVAGNPFHVSEVSDHLPVMFRLDCPRQGPPARKVIPMWLIKNPVFQVSSTSSSGPTWSSLPKWI